MIFPPRPGASLPPEVLAQPERWQGWIGEPKLNGNRVLVSRGIGESLRLFTRHREPFRRYRMPADLRANLLALPLGLYDGELLDGKVTGVEDEIALFDLLGDPWLGTTLAERLVELDRRCWAACAVLGYQSAPPARFAETGERPRLGHHVGRFVFQVERFLPAQFTTAYRLLSETKEAEGLVLKNLAGVLERPLAIENNGRWSVRIRKPSKVYSY